MLPSAYKIGYEAILRSAKRAAAVSLAISLQEKLTRVWPKVYLAMVSRPTNLASLRVGSFHYICDLYRELEVSGEVAFDQTIENRVVAVFGASARSDSKRATSRAAGGGASDQLFTTERDHGHFMAHSIGGSCDVNVFSQERGLNRGWSPQGKIFRRMERYCSEERGTFCFSRPIYTDGSSIPRWLEFGLLRNDQTLWVEIFDNQ